MTSKQKRKLTEFLFLVPTLLAFLMVIIIPFIYGIFYSFTDWQGTGSFSKMVGLENYKAIFNEPAFLHSSIRYGKITAFVSDVGCRSNTAPGCRLFRIFLIAVSGFGCLSFAQSAYAKLQKTVAYPSSLATARFSQVNDPSGGR